MANEQNLRPAPPFNELTPEEHQKIASAGGIASVAARQEKKIMRDALEKKLGSSLEKITESIIKRAIDGDVRAYETIRDTVGEKPGLDLKGGGEPMASVKIEWK